MLPCPKNLLDVNTVNGGWREWCVRNWGTPQDVPLTEVVSEMLPLMGRVDTKLTLVFDTQMRAPDAFAVWVSKNYPGLHIRLSFSNADLWLAGYVEIEDGEILQRKKVEMAFDDEGMPKGEYAEFLDENYLHCGG